ncbi:hypothetical protein [Streptomyces sp. MP131-18]|uniref:hypothetical protein n=1 Tax=Streptomyces sp. MP131-18 TaxID=1857892 RepID=UPI00097C5B06|nr:hypothetical protein [Streptomyces sp. MP131-18]ONK13266.1 hypothetical protein STBA_40290 [Streptomyces sp. MP131-18]
MPAVTNPVGSLALPAELYAHNISQYCPSQDYPTVRAILDDAKPMEGESAYHLCHRPVHETGAGYGDGFNLGYELGCVSVALSNLLREVSGGWNTGEFTEAGITKAMVRDAQKALSNARDAWDAQRAEQCARGFACVELARYSVDGTIALRLVCTCGCSHEPRRLFYGATSFDAAETDRRLAANLERWGMRLTGPWSDHRYETNWFGTTRRAPVAPR